MEYDPQREEITSVSGLNWKKSRYFFYQPWRCLPHAHPLISARWAPVQGCPQNRRFFSITVRCFPNKVLNPSKLYHYVESYLCIGLIFASIVLILPSSQTCEKYSLEVIPGVGKTCVRGRPPPAFPILCQQLKLDSASTCTASQQWHARTRNRAPSLSLQIRRRACLRNSFLLAWLTEEIQ